MDMTARTEIIEHAAGNLAISKLVPVGEYLDMVEAGERTLNPERYQSMAASARHMVTQFRKHAKVRACCAASPALRDILDNADFAAGEGPLALYKRLMQKTS